jgi:(p)ppGpp synthase/HD superfamily hydrolase
MLTSRFSQALVYAAEAHNGQTRKGTGVPYVAHVLAVAALALENGANEDEAIAALLHDTVEDCGGLPRLADVRERFGEAVASIVMGCSDSTETPKPPWRQRKQAYIHDLDKASPSVLLVSACDKLHNVRSLLVSVRNDGDAAWARFKGGREGTLWYYRAVLAALKRCGASPRLMHELEISLEELHRAVDSKVPLSDVHFPDA